MNNINIIINEFERLGYTVEEYGLNANTNQFHILFTDNSEFRISLELLTKMLESSLRNLVQEKHKHLK